MRYHEAADFLFALRRFSVRPGTESVAALLDHLGNPEGDVPFVQVAGSNGKGSTARMVESVLREAGLQVGLYTSPHLEDLSERIRVDGRPMADEHITSFVETVRPWLLDRAAAGQPLTFFEVVTAMGIWQFARRNVDVAVLEVGMGGEYDATSVVDPIAAAITNVSLEHTRVLGDSVEEIARTKAKIATDDVPVVTACEGDALAVVREVVGDVTTVAPATTGSNSESDTTDAPDSDTGTDAPDSAADIVVTYEGRVSHTDSRVTVRDDAGWPIGDAGGGDGGDAGGGDVAGGGGDDGGAAGQGVGGTADADQGDHTGHVPGGPTDLDLRIPLVGAHQATNAAIAVGLVRKTLDALDVGLTERQLADGLARAYWPGRFDVVGTAPLVVLDGAHNPAACGTLGETLASYEYDDLHLVFAAMHDKDHEGMVEALPDPASVVTCRPDIDRAEDPAVLAGVFENAGIEAAVAPDADHSVASAMATARASAGPTDAVVLTGSLFAVAEARATDTRTVVGKRVDSMADARNLLAGADVPTDAIDRVAPGVTHEVVKTRLPGRQTARLRTEALSAGVTCGVSGLESAGEATDVVLAGTRDQFADLLDSLADASAGLPGVAADIEERLRIGSPAVDPDPTDSPAYPWESGTAVMGVLNVTPDSFHDGGRHEVLEDAVTGAEQMVEAGADILDIGGESTRPGADPVSVEDEIDRVVPVIEAIQDVTAVADGDVLVSVDTRKPAVAEAALDAGADVINDVTGLEDPEMRDLVAARAVPVVIMHSLDAPVVPDREVEYEDVVEDVLAELQERVLRAETAGIPRDRVIIDPGLGFGKSAIENFELLDRIDEFQALGCPVMVGHSHKSMFEHVDRGPDDRRSATVAGTALATDRGVDIVRVHDVAENRAAVDVVTAARQSRHDDAGTRPDGRNDG